MQKPNNFKELVQISGYQVVKEYAEFFQKIFDEPTQSIKTLPVFFQHGKRYRKIRGFEAFGKRFYLKEYFSRFDEAEAEWKNLHKLKVLGYSVPEPFFFRRSANKVEISTFEVKGIPLSELLITNLQEGKELLIKLSGLLASLHSMRIYHQDCYLNHFYWDKDTMSLCFLDVSRVLFNPPFPLRYQIKDLGQMGYSFEEYLGEDGRKAFQKFLSYYFDNLNRSLKNKPLFIHKGLIRLLTEIKIWLIRRRTLKAKKKGKVL